MCSVSKISISSYKKKKVQKNLLTARDASSDASRVVVIVVVVVDTVAVVVLCCVVLTSSLSLSLSRSKVVLTVLTHVDSVDVSSLVRVGSII